MDPISLILAALVAGAAKTADSVDQDVYNGLKALIKRKFESQGKSDSAMILDKYEQKPEKTKALLEDELTEIGADKDEEIVKLAEKLNEQLSSKKTVEGEHGIYISGGTVQGVTGSNSGTLNQNFGKVQDD